MRGRGRELGRWAEDLASKYLGEKGFRVLARNLRLRTGEVDLVCLDGDELVFVEVRCRTDNPFQGALESVGPRKMRKVLLCARSCVEMWDFCGNWRVDVVAITVCRDGSYRVEHLVDVVRL